MAKMRRSRKRRRTEQKLVKRLKGGFMEEGERWALANMPMLTLNFTPQIKSPFAFSEWRLSQAVFHLRQALADSLVFNLIHIAKNLVRKETSAVHTGSQCFKINIVFFNFLGR